MTDVYIIAGEASGDQLGADMMEAARRLDPSLTLRGIGGPLLEAQGLRSSVPMSELSINGAVEVLRHLPNIRRRLKQVEQELADNPPDILITVDAPGFTFRIGKAVKAAGRTYPHLHYVAPTVWAWKPGRAQKIAQFLDRLLVVLPFEPPYFERHGLTTDFVGHPVIAKAATGDPEAFRTAYDLQDRKLLAILPGSRMGEINRLLPVYGDALRRLDLTGWQPVLPTLPHLRARVETLTAHWPVRPLIPDDTGNRWDMFRAFDMALATSGTVAVELAAAGVPALIGYRFHPLTAMIARRVVKVRFGSLINILADKALQPEFIQQDCTPQRLAGAMRPYLTDPAVRAAQVAAVAEQTERMRAPSETSGHLAAAAMLSTLRTWHADPEAGTPA